jgi:exodeoxyribonuclease-5
MVKETGWSKRVDELEKYNLLKKEQVTPMKDMLNSPDEENAFITKEIIRLKIKDKLIEGLSRDQTKAFINIIEFLKYGKEDAIVLKGYAGTGKTFLVKRVLEYINVGFPNRRIAVTAPTNKAVKVLNTLADFGDNTKVFEDLSNSKDRTVYATIHKLLGLKESISANGVQSFKPGKRKDVKITDFKYLIVDEVSMLNDDLFEAVMEFKDKLKIIFMGDPAQIPPVGELYSLPFQEDTDYNLAKVELNEIMRQKGDNAIISASMTLRENLNELSPISGITTSLNESGDGIVHLNAQTERHRVRELINEHFLSEECKMNPDHIKIIAWRNASVSYLNSVVRECVFGSNDEKFYVGEMVVANKPLFDRINSKYGNSKEYKITASTSDEFAVKEVSIVNRTFKEKYKKLPIINFEGTFWKLKVNGDNKQFLYVIHEDSLDEYNALLKDIKSLAIKNRDKDYWVLYYNISKWSDNITYSYAITAHKSQGSTYDNVILLEEDLDMNKKIFERNRIKYTAYTRAAKKLYILK